MGRRRKAQQPSWQYRAFVIIGLLVALSMALSLILASVVQQPF